jgi:ribosomal protein S18 acetylase RimI-like enzyme
MDSGNGVFAMVMESNREIIGTAILNKPEQERKASLVSFYLLPNKIGLGFGHAFYGKIESELKNLGCSGCAVVVLKDNKKAIRFYKAHGFVAVGREENTLLGERDYLCIALEKDFFLPAPH